MFFKLFTLTANLRICPDHLAGSMSLRTPGMSRVVEANLHLGSVNMARA